LAIACAARTFDWGFADDAGVAMLGASKAHYRHGGNPDFVKQPDLAVRNKSLNTKDAGTPSPPRLRL
jgi:hypothetical protein